MEGLAAYRDSSDEEGEEEKASSSTRALSLSLAPRVDVIDSSLSLGQSLVGPENPFRRRDYKVEETAVDEVSFHKNFHQQDPTGRKKRPRRVQSPSGSSTKEGTGKSKRKLVLAGVELEEDEETIDQGTDEGVPKEQKEYLEGLKRKVEDSRRRAKEEGEEKAEECKMMETVEGARSKFHGQEEVDYQGRGWATPPSTLTGAVPAAECRIPKRLIHTWKGHSKGVQAIEFSPQYAHLLLSGSLDTTCKIWGCYESSGGGNGRGLKRTYSGHEEPIRAICFGSDGTKFASSGYDRKILIWDVESGQCEYGWKVGATANAVKFFPEDNNIMLAACSNRMVLQFDRREGKVVQKYQHHLGPVNTLTFFDKNRRFISTSDDKVLLAWELNTPVPIKYVQGPSMQSLPVVRHHPREEYVVCQSMDNQILTFEAGERVKADRRTFTGHNNAGFACGIDFSPNGKFVMSGDSGGKLFFWDWRSARKYRELQAHSNNPCLGAIWHPIEPSWVATCAWDGLIKLWE